MVFRYNAVFLLEYVNVFLKNNFQKKVRFITILFDLQFIERKAF